MKKKLETICVVIVLILSIANIKICADAINILSSNNTENIDILKENIENNQDLIGKGRVSRLAPATEMELFVEQLELENKDIEIYKDIEKKEKIEEGLIATGMVMTLKEENKTEGKDYELSVVGDINRDGRANIVETVQIINHIVEFEGKELTGLSYISGDINGDKEINIVDVTQLIRYIVFEELEIGEMVWEEPLVEEGIPEKEIGKIYAIEDLVDLATMVNNGTFEEEYRKVHGEEAQIVVTLERDLDFKDAKTYRTENPETMPYTDEEGNEIDANGDGIIEPIMAELTTGIGFQSIGIMNYEDQSFIPFKSSFDGKGNKISNLYINITEEEIINMSSRLEEKYGDDAKQVFENLGKNLMNRALGLGLFGAIEAGENETVEIKNLTIENANIKAGMALAQAPIAFTTGKGNFEFTNLSINELNLENLSQSEENYCAGIVGMTMGTGNHIFTECNLDDFTIQGGAIVAGLLGGNQQKINVEISKCNVKESSLESFGIATGFMGVSMSAVDNGTICAARIIDSNVSNTNMSGMMVTGMAYIIGAESSTIENCHISNSNLNGEDVAVGFTYGVIGQESNNIIGCSITESDIISEEGAALGLAYVIMGKESKVISSSITNTDFKGKNGFGGLVGSARGKNIEIKDSFIKGGTIETSSENSSDIMGGIIAYCEGDYYTTGDNILNITGCSLEDVEINTTAMVGGICGSVERMNLVNIDKCYNTSKLPNGGAGILLYSSRANVVITNCYNCGKVEVDKDKYEDGDAIAAGIYGVKDNYSFSVEIQNCFNIGQVSGGIIHEDDNNGVFVTNCYDVGNSIVGIEETVPSEPHATITNCHELTGEETAEQKANVLALLNNQVESNNAEEDTITWSTWVIDGDENKGYPIFDWMIQN